MAAVGRPGRGVGDPTGSSVPSSSTLTGEGVEHPEDRSQAVRCAFREIAEVEGMEEGGWMESSEGCRGTPRLRGERERCALDQ